MKYKIKSGDTLSQIAKANGVSVSSIAKANNIKNVNKIFAGKTITIPKAKKSKTKKLKTKKSSSVERVNQSDPFFIQQEDSTFKSTAPKPKTKEKSKEKPKPKKKPKKKPKEKPKVQEKKITEEESFFPINIRQFFNPKQDRTEKDLSKAEQDTLKSVIAYSQKPEVRQAKIERGINPDTIRYSDYNALGAENLDQEGSTGSLIGKVTDPVSVLKSFLGRASLSPTDDGGFIVKDKFDFEPKTQETGLAKLSEYLQSIGDTGISDGYGQLRNFMGFYGPQEGTDMGGRSNIRIMQQGGDTMNIQQQTKNVAAQGRYGDSMLLHVNPAEVKGLASAMPITVNPQTGQPEAFLPFLAPILGSALATSLAGTGVLGATLAANSALAAGIGAGLATYAESGGSGSKALLSGITAGFGTNAANTAAQTAQTAGTTSALTSAGFSPETVANAAATATPRAATGSFNALTDTFSGGFDQGAKALASGAMSPSGMLAGAAAGSRGIIESQEAFARQMGESEEAYRRRREDMYRNTPEPTIFAAGGGRTGFLEGGYSGGYGFEPGNFTGGNLPQIFAPARTQYQVNPDFKAGFSPETMYFDPRTISAPASQLVPVQPELGPDTYKGSKGGYGGRQASIADQVSIDPFAAYTGSAPAGLEFSETTAPIAPPEIGLPIMPNPDEPVSGLPDFDSPDFQIPENFDLQSILDSINSYNSPEREIDTGAFTPQLPITEAPMLPFMPNTSAVEPDFVMSPNAMLQPDPAAQTMPASSPQTLGELLPPGTDNGIDISNFIGSREDNLAGAQAMFGPQVKFATGLEPNTDSGIGLGLGEMMTAEELIARGGTPKPNSGKGFFGNLGLGDEAAPIPEPIAATQFSPEIDFSNFNLTPEMLAAQQSVSQVMPEMLAPQLPQEVMPRNSILRTMDLRGQMAEGGKLPNAGLKALNKVAPEVVDNMGFEEGGMTDIQNDPLTKEVALYLLGQSNDEKALNLFLEKYGDEAFMQLRQMVLQSVVPNAQTEGQIAGVGNGGMDDDINGTIGNQEKIAVSQDEFIVPADVVSMLGDGSSNAGSKELYDMMDRVRQEKTGTTTQASKLANAGGMLPA